MIPLEVRVNLYEAHIQHYQGDVHSAVETLRQALILSRAIQDRRLEAETLLSLGLTRSDVGQYSEAEAQLLQAEQAYRDLGDRVTLGRLVVHRSRLYIARAEFARAKVALEQILPAVRAHGNQRAEGWAYVYLGEICGAGLGSHQEADEYFSHALEIAQATGDVRYEAYALWAWGLNALCAGDFDRAEQLLGQTLDLSRTAGGPVAVGRALHGLGLLANARGDEATAEDLARQALSLADDTGRLPEQAALLLLLGQVQENRGLPTAATSYARALTHARDLGDPALCCDAAAGLASVALAEGDARQAAEHAAAIVPYLWEHNLAGCDEPGRVLITCYRALRAVRDPRAEETLRLGVALLERRIAALPEASRTRYVAAFPARHELLAAWQEHQEVPVRRAGIPISLVPPPPVPAHGDHLVDDGIPRAARE
jgi:tetratricopeptide (TPR) repeat protein